MDFQEYVKRRMERIWAIEAWIEECREIFKDVPGAPPILTGGKQDEASELENNTGNQQDD